MWSPELLGITIRSTLSECVGTADPFSQILFSSACGELNHYCTVPYNFKFDIYFYVDVEGTSRPTPFSPPQLSLDLEFIDQNGNIINHIQEVDTQPTYSTDGAPLGTTFGTRFSINTSDSVTLKVHLEMNDIDTGNRVIYSDTIECNIIPCV